MKNIFIGGAGRSGTTIALHVAYCHPELYAVPIETKFIVEVDGLSSLVESMTDHFSVTASQEAKIRFEYLMRNVMLNNGANPYKRAYGQQEYNIADIFDNYEVEIDKFLQLINPISYFEERKQLIEMSRDLIDGLFSKKAQELVKIGWVEKTPSNMAQIQFLFELYPEAYFIHMVRDPRGVLFSLLRLKWCNPDINISANKLKQTLRFLEKKKKLAREVGYKFVDLHLEDLVIHTEDKLSELTSFIGISDYPKEQIDYLKKKLKQSSIKYDSEANRIEDSWKGFSKKELQLVNSILGDEIEVMGYRI